MTPTQLLIEAIRAERYTNIHIADWVQKITGNRPAAKTVTDWKHGRSEPRPEVLRSLHARFQAEGHDAVGGLV